MTSVSVVNVNGSSLVMWMQMLQEVDWIHFAHAGRNCDRIELSDTFFGITITFLRCFHCLLREQRYTGWALNFRPFP